MTTPYKSRGLSGYIFGATFILLSAWALREMRLGPVTAKAGEHMEVKVNQKFIKEYGNVELISSITGIESVDIGLKYLIVAFLPGVLDLDYGQKLQSATFLLSFFPLVAIYSVEAGRQRNAGKWIRYTSLWALLYQTVGGAVIIPLWFLAYMSASSSAGYWTPESRAVPVSYARALLPSLIIGYLLPTVLMYIPWGNVVTTQKYVLLWQASPIYVNIFLVILAPLLSIGQSAPKTSAITQITELRHLKRVYTVSFAIGAITHWAAVFLCIFTNDTNITFWHAFWPRKDLFIGDNIHPTLPEALLYIFQMDYWIAFGSSLVWALLTVLDTNRVTGSSMVPAFQAAAVLGLNTILFGPAATVAAVAYSKEMTFAQTEAQQNVKLVKKKN